MTESKLKSTKIFKHRTAYTYLNKHDIKFALALKALHNKGNIVFVVDEKQALKHVVYLPEDRGIINIEGEAKVFEGTGIKNLPYAKTAPYYPTEQDINLEMRRRGINFEDGEKQALKDYILEEWNKEVKLFVNR